MNSMLWLRSLQEVFAPLRIFYVKDSQFMRSRGTNASSHGPAARQGSRFRGSIHLSRAIRFVLSDRAASRIRPCGVAYQKAARRHAGCAYRRGDPRRGEETARGDLLHGPLPRVASAFVFRQTWLRLFEGRPDAGTPGRRQPVSVNLLWVSVPRRPAPSFPAPAGSRCPVGCRTCGQRACPSAPGAPGRPA